MYLPDSEEDDGNDESENKANASEALNCFLVSTGKEPSPCTLQVPWETTSKKTQAFYVSKVKDVITKTVHTLAPNDTYNLLKATLNSITAGEINDETFRVKTGILMAVVESYNELSDPGERRQVLSIIADILPFKRLQKLIPEVTRHQVTQAKRHKEQFGKGASAPVSSGLPRERVDSSNVDHFLDFITSGHVIQDLPFGTKNIKMESGETIEILNVIRLVIPRHVVEQYITYCKEQEFEPLSKRTVLRILSTSFPALERKSLQGLDYYIADGGKAFDELLVVTEKLELQGCKEQKKG